MKFQNTDCCTSIERLKIVSDEILQEYPNLQSDDILKIACLCDFVSKNADNDDIFRRFYYILLVIKDDKYNFDIIYNDMLNKCRPLFNDNLNKYLYDDVVKYYNGEITSFPMISDYYNE